jgi:hypothetical protein
MLSRRRANPASRGRHGVPGVAGWAASRCPATGKPTTRSAGAPGARRRGDQSHGRRQRAGCTTGPAVPAATCPVQVQGRVAGWQGATQRSWGAGTESASAHGAALPWWRDVGPGAEPWLRLPTTIPLSQRRRHVRSRRRGGAAALMEVERPLGWSGWAAAARVVANLSAARPSLLHGRIHIVLRRLQHPARITPACAGMTAFRRVASRSTR